MGLSSIFGGGSPAPNFNAAQGYMSGSQAISQGLAPAGGMAANNYGLTSAANQNAINNYSQYLMSNPATESYNAGQVANAEKGASQQAQGAQANLDQQLASRGISPNSSAGVGGLASIDQGLAANNAQIESQVGQANIARHQANLATNANLMSAANQQAYGQDLGFAGQRASINQGLTDASTQQAMDTYQAQLAQQQANNAMYGAVGNAASMAFGGPPIFGGSAPPGSGAAPSGGSAPMYGISAAAPQAPAGGYQVGSNYGMTPLTFATDPYGNPLPSPPPSNSNAYGMAL